MIRHLKQWWASRRLAKLVEARRASFEIRDFAKRRAAMLKVTRPADV